MIRLTAFLALTACGAQASEPELKPSQLHSIEQFIALNCKADEPDCAKQCGDEFPTEDLTEYHNACLQGAKQQFAGDGV
jgi:hypothetical protein